MKKLISVAIVVMMVLGLMVPVLASTAHAAALQPNMWVNCADGKRLNVREAPTKNSRVLTRIECGKKVDILSDAGNGWAHIRYGNTDGYVMTKFLVSQKPGKYEITERDDNFRTVSAYTVFATAVKGREDQSVCLRTRPNKTARSIRRLTAGDALQVIAVGKTWSKVIDQTTGQAGYVANDYITAV